MASNDDGITIAAAKSSNPALSDFIRTTREEVKKVTWPERSETIRITVMVVVLALITGVFFLIVDSALGFAVSHILGMGAQ